MPTKDKQKNKEYVAKSRQKLKEKIGVEAYRKIEAERKQQWRKKKKALQNPHIQDRKLRSLDINELIKIREELKNEKKKKAKK